MYTLFRRIQGQQLSCTLQHPLMIMKTVMEMNPRLNAWEMMHFQRLLHREQGPEEPEPGLTKKIFSLPGLAVRAFIFRVRHLFRALEQE